MDFTGYVTPWEAIPPDKRMGYERELKREVSERHALYGKSCTAVARRVDMDDVLFYVLGEQCAYAVVHLTYNGREILPVFPYVTFFRSFEEWKAKCLLVDRDELL